MNILDIAALAILAISVLTAMIKGLVRELLSLASVVTGLILAILFYPAAGDTLEGVGVPASWSGFVGFILVFVGIVAAGAAIIHLFDRVLRALNIKWIDRLLGGVFGLFRGYLIGLAVFLALTAFPVGTSLVESSRLKGCFFDGAAVIMAVAPHDFGERVARGIEGVYERIRSREEHTGEPFNEPLR